jgi:hypothetical protein
MKGRKLCDAVSLMAARSADRSGAPSSRGGIAAVAIHLSAEDPVMDCFGANAPRNDGKNVEALGY